MNKCKHTEYFLQGQQDYLIIMCDSCDSEIPINLQPSKNEEDNNFKILINAISQIIKERESE